MKIIRHKDKSVTIQVTNTVSHKLNSQRDMTPDLASYLRVFDAYDTVMGYLLPHPQFNDPPALRAALSAALNGHTAPGHEILGTTIRPVIQGLKGLPARHGETWEHWEDLILKRLIAGGHHPSKSSLQRTPFACVCRAIRLGLLYEKNAYGIMRLWSGQ